VSRVTSSGPQEAGAEWLDPALTEPKYSSSLQRGLGLLACFKPERPVLGVAQLADQLGMSRSTTHRYASTLLALGYLRQVPGHRYALSVAVTKLGLAALNATALEVHATPYMQELCDRTRIRNTITLATLEGLHVVCVARVRAQGPGLTRRESARGTGSQSPAYCTAIGKVLLANLPARIRRERFSEMTLKSLAPNTITSKRKLASELEKVRDEGFAVADQEQMTGVQAIAVPVRNTEEEVVAAALALSTASSAIKLEALVEHLMPHLIATADRISTRLGHRRDDER
jgi:IclR family pca regulon transcriptional regulator